MNTLWRSTSRGRRWPEAYAVRAASANAARAAARSPSAWWAPASTSWHSMTERWDSVGCSRASRARVAACRYSPPTSARRACVARLTALTGRFRATCRASSYSPPARRTSTSVARSTISAMRPCGR
ncbi:hypothetical protein [Georgenia sp. SUBG003]|uniref:hypothetical protein n=1 Tax=Georgenia sp. SUBG003 TaxID=1497974 RepID=UPI003AB1BF83